MKSNFLTAWLRFILVATLVIVSIGSTTTLAQSPKLKIGVISALSGPVAEAGTSVKNGVQLADSYYDNSNDVEFIFEDDQFSAKQAVSAAEKLITKDGVSALITFSGTVSLAVAAIAERREIPMIAITGFTKVSVERKFVYTLFVSIPTQNALLASVIERKSLERAAVITAQQDTMLAMRDAFVSTHGQKIVSQQEVAPSDNSFHTIATKVLAQKPDVVYELTIPPQTSQLAKLLREQGYSGVLVGGPAMFNPIELAASRGALSGGVFPGPKRGAALQMLKDYASKYGQPCMSEGLYAFDAASILISLSEAPSFKDAFSSLRDVRGINGKYSISDDRLIEVPGELLTMTDTGDAVPLP